jgi:hypothetical protein
MQTRRALLGPTGSRRIGRRRGRRVDLATGRAAGILHAVRACRARAGWRRATVRDALIDGYAIDRGGPAVKTGHADHPLAEEAVAGAQVSDVSPAARQTGIGIRPSVIATHQRSLRRAAAQCLGFARRGTDGRGVRRTLTPRRDPRCHHQRTRPTHRPSVHRHTFLSGPLAILVGHSRPPLPPPTSAALRLSAVNEAGVWKRRGDAPLRVNPEGRLS